MANKKTDGEKLGLALRRISDEIHFGSIYIVDQETGKGQVALQRQISSLFMRLVSRLLPGFEVFKKLPPKKVIGQKVFFRTDGFRFAVMAYQEGQVTFAALYDLYLSRLDIFYLVDGQKRYERRLPSCDGGRYTHSYDTTKPDRVKGFSKQYKKSKPGVMYEIVLGLVVPA